jgi:hypothetical protein
MVNIATKSYLGRYILIACFVCCCGCQSNRITATQYKGHNIQFKINDSTKWLNESELPNDIDESEINQIKTIVNTYVDNTKKEEARNKTIWESECMGNVVLGIEKSLPVGYSVTSTGNLVFVSDCLPITVSELLPLLNMIESKCHTVRGIDRVLKMGIVRVYYAKDEQSYQMAYKSIYGNTPKGNAGICNFNYPPRIFGLESVGNGSISHELVHVYMMADWPDLPYWLNEGMAVSIGCPIVQLKSKDVIIKDLHMYVALQAIRQNKWCSLANACNNINQIDDSTDNEMVDLPSMVGYQACVGPAATGIMFTRWVLEIGKLPVFYQSLRDTNSITNALASTFPGESVDALNSRLVAWISGHYEANMVVALPIRQ